MISIERKIGYRIWRNGMKVKFYRTRFGKWIATKALNTVEFCEKHINEITKEDS